MTKPHRPARFLRNRKQRSPPASRVCRRTFDEPRSRGTFNQIVKQPPYPIFPELMPPEEISSGAYIMKFAQTTEQLDEIFRLRYEVFNLELEEGLEESHETARDQDDYDLGCHHLIIAEKASGTIIGTYRMQTREMARAHNGFYSLSEFDLTMLPEELLSQVVELGRACISRDHRSGRVLYLLWRGLLRYLLFNDKRFFFGCSSLTGMDPAVGLKMMNYLKENEFVHPDYWVEPQPEYACPSEGVELDDEPVNVPTLMEMYLNHGVRVCSPPAIDRHFKTIDFLVLFDVDKAGDHFKKLFIN